MNKLFKTLCLILSIFLGFSVSISCLHSLDNDNSNNSSNGNSNQQQEQQVDFSNLTYLAFGDSITAGDPYGNTSSYPYLTSQLLNCKLVNKGFGGSTLAFYSARRNIANDIINFSIDNNYDIISVTGGTNDHNYNRPLGTVNDYNNDTVYGALNMICDSLKNRCPNAFIFLITPIPNSECYSNNDAGYKLVDIANIIKVVGYNHNIPVLDLYNLSEFEKAPNGMYSSSCDGCHPTKDFAENNIAPLVAQFIKDNYKK